MSEKGENNQVKLSRRQFLKDAGIVVGTTVVGSAFFLSACGKEIEVTKTVTTTAPGTTSTVTKTAAGGTVTQTQTVSKYTCPVCSVEFNSLDALKTHFDASHIAAEEPTGMISMKVNGEDYMLQVQPTDTLRDVLRHKLGLLSIKDMCLGYGACGSCTVIMDGRPILSCMTLACHCDGVEIETSEGIARDKHPLIDTYVDNYCMQCGYCTPGFVVTSKALLDHNPNPTEADIREALAGNLCRCATYIQHIPAVQQAANALKGGS